MTRCLAQLESRAEPWLASRPLSRASEALLRAAVLGKELMGTAGLGTELQPAGGSGPAPFTFEQKVPKGSARAAD